MYKNGKEKFYQKHFGQIAGQTKLPLKYFMNPFKNKIPDCRKGIYNEKQLRSAKNYFKTVFSSETFSEEFKKYVEGDLVEDYLLETPVKFFCILRDLFYFHGRREKRRFSWNVPWRFNEVQLALEQTKKSLF